MPCLYKRCKKQRSGFTQLWNARGPIVKTKIWGKQVSYTISLSTNLTQYKNTSDTSVVLWYKQCVGPDAPQGSKAVKKTRQRPNFVTLFLEQQVFRMPSPMSEPDNLYALQYTKGIVAICSYCCICGLPRLCSILDNQIPKWTTNHMSRSK